MPVYEFKCSECGETYENLRNDAHEYVSCRCGGALKRVWSVGLLRENIRAVKGDG